MITWLIGDNSFEVHEALAALVADFMGVPERFDGPELSLAQLPDLLMGMSLFSTQRLVVITDISKNEALWEKLPEWLPRVNEDIHLVFVDAKPDKRRVSYKALKQVAEVREFAAWSERDTTKAEQWVGERAARVGLRLSGPIARQLVERVGLDQWQLARAIDTLSLLDDVTPQAIDAVIPANPTESVFQLFETALSGQTRQTVDKLTTLSLHEDPYALFALLSSQALTFAAISFADQPAAASKEFAIHPFVASKMTAYARKHGKTKAASIVRAFARTDADMKRSKADPWLLIERLLLEITTL